MIILNIILAVFMIIENRPDFLVYYQMVIVTGFLADAMTFKSPAPIVFLQTYMYIGFMLSFNLWGFTCFFYSVFSTFKLPDIKEVQFYFACLIGSVLLLALVESIQFWRGRYSERKKMIATSFELETNISSE